MRDGHRNQRTRRGSLLLAGLLFAAMTGIVRADDQLDKQYPAATGTAAAEQVEAVLKRLKQIQTSLQDRKIPLPGLLNLNDDGIAAYLDTPYFAQFNTGQQQQRFLLGRLHVINQSENDLEFDLSRLRLQINGQAIAMAEKADQKRYASARLNGRHYSLSEFKPAAKLTIPVGQVASSWVVFSGLDAGNDVPALALTWMMNGQPFELNLQQQHAALLNWKREQIGPRGVVAVGTIGGELNTINLGTILDDLVDAATQNITRVVIQFDPEAPAVDPHMAQWLQELARRAGIEMQHQQFTELPMLPPMIREFHLAGLPESNRNPSRSIPQPTSRKNRTEPKQQTLLDAYLAASASAYEAVPLADLLKEAEQGHPLSRCAALRFGAIRLPASYLPRLLELARQPEATVAPYEAEFQISAIVALSEFNDRRSVELLKELAAHEDKELAEAALNSLGMSRFPGHQNALMSLLDSESELRQEVLKTLARFPRKRWADTLYQQAISGPVVLQVEATRALNTIGHPQLKSLLMRQLESDQPELKDLALELLSSRDDPESRERVIQHALHMLGQTTHQQSLQVVSRFKDQRAIPLLLNLLKTDKNQRQSIIQTLSTIGDDRILNDLLAIYPDLNSNEKSSVLRTLAQIDQIRFIEFSRTALQSDDTQVASTIGQLMQESASIEAVDVLIEAIEANKENKKTIGILVSALGNFSTAESRRYLIQLRDDGPKELRQQARSSLESMYYRSPGYHVYQQAAQTLKTDNKTLAIQQFTFAMEIDPSLPHSYQGRADCYRQLDRLEDALTDYNSLLDLDPAWPNGQGSRGMTLTSMSRFADSLPSLDKAIEQDRNNANWFSARGHAHSMLEHFEEAERDYRKALELNPKHMTALTGVALSLAIAGKVDEAIQLLDEKGAEFAKDRIFAYNSACTYARAAEALQRQAGESDAHKQKIIELVDKALDELERSVELGYIDANWTKADPDLKMLREQERFNQALAKMRQTPEVSAPKPVNEDAPIPE